MKVIRFALKEKRQELGGQGWGGVEAMSIKMTRYNV